MNEAIRLLQAEIKADLAIIEQIFVRLNDAWQADDMAEREIVAGYYLNVLYGQFENMFERIAERFGNQIKNRAQWHAQLLTRMTLDVPDVRPAVIGSETFAHLNELRRFRHVFRNAYLLTFDPRRMVIVMEEARALHRVYPADLEQFNRFLDSLVIDG